MRWAHWRLKTNREENLTKHVEFVYPYVKNISYCELFSYCYMCFI